jgi:hemerythrin-like domain-containing protein
MAHGEQRPEGLCQLLVREHERLDGVFAELLEALHADAREDVQRLWTQFEEDLGAHMALEEEYILEALAHDGPEEARALLRDHDDIRRKLAEFGVGVELHRVGADVVRAFVRQLREHARRENEHSYRWAERYLGADAQEHIRRRLGAAELIRKTVPGPRTPREVAPA